MWVVLGSMLPLGYLPSLQEGAGYRSPGAEISTSAATVGWGWEHLWKGEILGFPGFPGGL